MKRIKKNILVCILNWGLGHAVRSAVIIKQLRQQGHRVYFASDGIALQFLRKEFPTLKSFELPAYDVQYKWSSLLVNVMAKSPKILRATIKEQAICRALTDDLKLDLIISDNRLGCYSKKIKTVYISHQIKLPISNPILSYTADKLHHFFIKKYNCCWIPDVNSDIGLAGKLSTKPKLKNVTYLGPLSNLKIQDKKKTIRVLVILSGPEPQRSAIESILIKQAQEQQIKLHLVRGTTASPVTPPNKFIKSYNLLNRTELQHLMDSSEVLITRSGYTSLMDIYVKPVKVFFIPTPGQWEQEYLAKHWRENFKTNFAEQDKFSLKKAIDQALIPDFSTTIKTRKQKVDIQTLLDNEIERPI